MPLPSILHEDDVLIAFDKPASLPVVSEQGAKARQENLMDVVRARYGEGVATVHRLDAETGGVLLCAKTKPALDFLSGQFQGKTAHKIYHTLVAVLPPEATAGGPAVVRTPAGLLPETFTVELAIAEDEHQCGRMIAGKLRGSRPAVTEFRILENFGRFAWLECRPLTSRTHQVRVHLAVSRLPVLNDPLYSVPEIELRLSALKRGYKGRDNEQPLIRCLALHASSLTVKHPATGVPITFTAPLPREFEVALKNLRKFSTGARRTQSA
jgi:23S rRNA pseudouridine1911/1915/1917 synthase